jgi:hypothetical protein
MQRATKVRAGIPGLPFSIKRTDSKGWMQLKKTLKKNMEKSLVVY